MKTLSIASLSFAFLLLSPATSQAQTEKKLDYSTCTNYLECAVQYAKSQLALLGPQIEAYSQKGEGYKICEADRLDFLHAYYLWMIKNEAELRDLEGVLDNMNGVMSEKAKVIQATQIDMIPEEGQTVSELKIGFSEITSYFKNLNQRIASTPKEMIPDLLARQEDPKRNPLKVKHSQIIHAIQMSSDNMNTGLKKEAAGFSVTVVTKDNLFDYVLRYQPSMADEGFLFEQSLINPKSVVFTASDTEKWKILTQKKFAVEGYTLDGQMRFIQMQKKLRLPKCKKENWDRVVKENSFTPLSSLDNLNRNFPTAPTSNQMTGDNFCAISSQVLVDYFNMDADDRKLEKFAINYIRHPYGGIVTEGTKKIMLARDGNEVVIGEPGSSYYGGNILSRYGRKGSKFTLEDIEKVKTALDCI